MFSLIIPTYNERNNILPLLDQIKVILQKIDYEIIVVDDNSPDMTWQLVDELKGNNVGVRLLRRMNARGLSSAVVEGFRMSRGKILGVIDADHSHDASRLPQMIQLIQSGHANCVVGSRLVDSTAGYGIQLWHRALLTRTAIFLARLMTGVKVTDLTSGFFCVEKKLFESIQYRLKPRGYKILLEILAKTDLQVLKVREVSYRFSNRASGRSKISLTVLFSFLIQIIDLFLFRAARQRFLHNNKLVAQ